MTLGISEGRITEDMTPENAARVMAERNIGVTAVLLRILQEDAGLGYIALKRMDDIGLYGEHIWIAFKDYFDRNHHLFILAMLEADPENRSARTLLEAVAARDYIDLPADAPRAALSLPGNDGSPLASAEGEPTRG